jgi:hypothetical protein
MPHTRILTALLMAVLPALQCHAPEKDELALVMRQLDQVQAGLTAPAWWRTRPRMPAFTSIISRRRAISPP